MTINNTNFYVLKMHKGQSLALVPATSNSVQQIAFRKAFHLTPTLFVPIMINLIIGTFLPVQHQTEDNKLRTELRKGNKTHKYLQLERIGPNFMVYILRRSIPFSFSKVPLERRHFFLYLGVRLCSPTGFRPTFISSCSASVSSCFLNDHQHFQPRPLF